MTSYLASSKNLMQLVVRVTNPEINEEEMHFDQVRIIIESPDFGRCDACYCLQYLETSLGDGGPCIKCSYDALNHLA